MLALAAVLLAAPQAPDPAAAARPIVQKAIDAAGGAELLGKLKAGTGKIKGQLANLGTDIDFTGEMAYEVPGRYKLTLSADIAGSKTVVTQAVDGAKMKWTTNGASQDIDERVKAEIGMAAKLMEVMQLVPLLDTSRYYTLAAEKDADMDGKPAAVVLVKAKDFKDTRLFFAKDTGLVVRTERKSLHPGTSPKDLQEVTETTTFADYRKTDGILLPFKATVTHDGKKFMTFSYTEAKLTEKVDPKLIGTD